MRIRPADCCFVPERRQELTTEGGLDVAAQLDALSGACKRLEGVGTRASLFIDPDPRQIEAAREVGATVIEIQPDAMRTRRIPVRGNASFSVSLRRFGWAQVRGCESTPDTASIIRMLARLRLSPR